MFISQFWLFFLTILKGIEIMRYKFTIAWNKSELWKKLQFPFYFLFCGRKKNKIRIVRCKLRIVKKKSQFWLYISQLQGKNSKLGDINSELWELKSELWDNIAITFLYLYSMAETSFCTWLNLYGKSFALKRNSQRMDSCWNDWVSSKKKKITEISKYDFIHNKLIMANLLNYTACPMHLLAQPAASLSN